MNKPALAMKSIPTFRVQYQDFEQYVQQVYGFEYDFMFAVGVTGPCGVDIEVNGELPSLAWEHRARELRAGSRDRDPRLILNVLCKDGYIPAGKYTVTTKAKADPTTMYRELLQRNGDPKADDCLRFRAEHAGDSVFLQRADVLDKCFVEAQAA